jgi:hypothetical protein
MTAIDFSGPLSYIAGGGPASKGKPMSMIFRLALVAALGAALSGCAVAEVGGDVVGAGIGVASTAVDVTTTAVSTTATVVGAAANTVAGSDKKSDDKSDDNKKPD